MVVVKMVRRRTRKARMRDRMEGIFVVVCGCVVLLWCVMCGFVVVCGCVVVVSCVDGGGGVVVEM